MEQYAVIQTGGKQYTVQSGDVLNVELISGASEGDTVELTTLAAKIGSDLKVGTPELTDKVKATVVGFTRGDKVLVFKKRRRETYRVKNGHRQNYVSLRIDSIPAN